MIIDIGDYGYIVSNINDVISNNNYYYKSRAKSLIIMIGIVMSPLQLMSSALQQYRIIIIVMNSTLYKDSYGCHYSCTNYNLTFNNNY